MSTIHPKHPVSLCSFTFADGRRCRAPRHSPGSQFCEPHARQEALAQAASELSQDIAACFSGEYVSACNLSAVIARLFLAVVQGDIKPKTARTLAYLAQTLLQTIHLAEHEYVEAFCSDTWRHAIRSSLDARSFPPSDPSVPRPQPPPAPPCGPDCTPAAGLYSASPVVSPSSSSSLPAVPNPSAASAFAPLPAPSSPVGARQAVPAPCENAPASNQPSTPAAAPPQSAPHSPPTPPQPSAAPPASRPFAQTLLPKLAETLRSARPVGGAGFQPVLPPCEGPQSAIPTNPPSAESAAAPPNMPSSPPVGARHAVPAPCQDPPAAKQPSPPDGNSSPSTLPSPANPAPAHQLPGFGKPANWDALMPSKPIPRRRRSLHWPR